MAPIVTGTDPVHDLPHSVRQDLRVLPTEELLWQRDLMGFVQLDSDDLSSVIAAAIHRAISDEIAYRRRLVEQHAGNPVVPRWPDTASRRYRGILERARDLKTLWPIETFVTRLLGVELRRVGRRLIGTCPLPDHRDSDPSFNVYPADDRWHCFGCGRGGDIFELTGLYFGLDRFREKVERVEAATPGLSQEAS